jgi:hypothetical protein
MATVFEKPVRKPNHKAAPLIYSNPKLPETSKNDGTLLIIMTGRGQEIN